MNKATRFVEGIRNECGEEWAKAATYWLGIETQQMGVDTAIDVVGRALVIALGAWKSDMGVSRTTFLFQPIRWAINEIKCESFNGLSASRATREALDFRLNAGIKQLKKERKQGKVSEETIKEIEECYTKLKLMGYAESLNKKIGGDTEDSEALELIETVSDKYSMLPDRISDLNTMYNLLDSNAFTKKERSCFYLYYREGRTYKEIGIAMGVTAEGARQIVERVRRCLQLALHK